MLLFLSSFGQFFVSAPKGHAFHGDKATIFYLTSEYYSLYVLSAKLYFLEIGSVHQKLMYDAENVEFKSIVGNYVDSDD